MNNVRNKKSTAYENLKKKIISGLLQPGEALNEGALSKELKISKTPSGKRSSDWREMGLSKTSQVGAVLSQESPSRTLGSSSRFVKSWSVKW